MKTGLNKIFLLGIFSLLSLGLIFTTDILSVFAFEQSSGLSTTGEGAGYSDTPLAAMSVPEIIGLVIRTLLLFVGVFFLILTMYAGFKWMFSRGNQTDIEIAKKTLQNSIIGLVIVLLAYALTIFIGQILTSGWV
jgi:hypothetical protein